MFAVSYDHQLPYVYDGLRPFPGLWVTLSTGPIELQALAALDSGAEISLFDGTLARMLGIDLLTGSPQRFVSTTGIGVSAYLHRVSIDVPDAGKALVQAAFSTGPLLRNLLGRDFFYSFKVGFQERMGVVNLLAESDSRLMR